MPINYKLYPSNWKSEIRPSILKRANNCCEFCKVANYSVYVLENNNRVFLKPSTVANFYLCSDEKKRMVGKTGNWVLKKVVLTISHLDHDISNNCPTNLKALCQKCHLSHDKDHHRKNARQTLKTKKGLLELEF